MSRQTYAAELVLNVAGPAGVGKTTAIEDVFARVPEAAIFRVHTSLKEFAYHHGLEPDGGRTAYFAAYNAMHSPDVRAKAAAQGEIISSIPQQILNLAQAHRIVLVDELRSAQAAHALLAVLGSTVFRTLAMTGEQGILDLRIENDKNRQPGNSLCDPLSGPMSPEEARGIGRYLKNYDRMMKLHSIQPGELDTTYLSREQVAEHIRTMIQPLVPDISLMPETPEH